MTFFGSKFFLADRRTQIREKGKRLGRLTAQIIWNEIVGSLPCEDWKAGRERGDDRRHPSGGRVGRWHLPPCNAAADPTVDAEAPARRERRDQFCRHMPINHLYLYFLILL
jgi:hypothetical protein